MVSYQYSEIYQALSTRSKRAIRKTRKKWGHWNPYFPKSDLVERLQKQFLTTEDDIRNRLAEIRWQILLEQGLAHVPQLNPFV